MPPTTEKTFQGLKLLAFCGGGAYGEVWYCEDLSGRRMAVKIVSKTRLGDAWKRELQGVINYRRITENSPSLLRIFHVAEDGENFYYTMEAADSASAAGYVPDTLAHRLKSGALPPEQLFPVLMGVFNGLAAIHQAGFAHRDIKPDNILFVGGMPKLADIGLVSSLSNSLTRLAGTLDFLPPEERGGDTPGSTDRASRQRNDLYAFGKVVYCAATGLEPGRYPSLPTDIKLSLELKLFLRLAFRLCARDSRLRIGDLTGLYREMKRIERQLESGETFTDKMRYAGECLSRGLLAGALGLRRSWWVFVLLGMLFGGLAYYLRREYLGAVRKIEKNTAEKTRDRVGKTAPAPPEKPVPEAPKPAPSKKPAEPEKPAKNKNYSIASLGLEMRIPAYWQAMSEEHIRAQVDEMTKELNETTKDENAKNMLRHAIARAKTWKGMIRCDLYDAIEISRIEAPAAQLRNLWTMPTGELKRVLLAQYGALGTKDAETYEIERTTLAGRRCVVFDFTLDRKDRIKNCMLLDDSGVVVIALTADAATFKRRVREFDAALKTLKFAAPPPKYAPPEPVAPPKPKAKPASEPPKPEVKPTPKTPEPAPAPPDDPNTRKYVNRKHGFTMRVPLHWEQMSRMYTEKLIRDQQTQLKRGGKNAEMTKFKLEHLQNILRNGGTSFRCDIDAKFSDTVEIAPLDVKEAELWNLNDEDIRGMYQLEADKRSMPVAFYSVAHAEVAGRNALLVESSNRVDAIQSLSCMILVSDRKILTFALSAKRANYAKRKQEFDAALKTLEFTAPAPKNSETAKPVQKTQTAAEPILSAKPALPNEDAPTSGYETPKVENVFVEAKVPPERVGRYGTDTIMLQRPSRYVNSRHHFSMRLPAGWTPMTRGDILNIIRAQQNAVNRGGRAAMTGKLRREHFRSLLHNNETAFFCCLNKNDRKRLYGSRCLPIDDNAAIASGAIRKEKIWKLSDDVIKKVFQTSASRKPIPGTIHSVSRTRIADRDALLVESSNNADALPLRFLNCIVFVDDNKVITFTLSADTSTFDEHKPEFEDALKTLKFEK